MKILYISNNDGGAPKTLLNIIRSVRQWVEPIVLFNHRGDESLVFEQEGIECIYIPFIYEIHYKDIFANKSLYEKYRYIRYRLFGSVIINKKLPSLVRKALNGRKIDIVHTNTAAITIGMNIAQYLVNSKTLIFKVVLFGGGTISMV